METNDSGVSFKDENPLCPTVVALASVATIPLAAEQWTPLAGEIQLPGTTDEARNGTPNTAREPGRLTRVYPYVGAAWYQRDIDVPAAWAGIS